MTDRKRSKKTLPDKYKKVDTTVSSYIKKYSLNRDGKFCPDTNLTP